MTSPIGHSAGSGCVTKSHRAPASHRQRLTERTVAYGTEQARTTRYHHDPRGLLERIELPAATAATAAGSGGSIQGRSITYLSNLGV